jgi:surfeit locus 1 family protein
MTITRGRLHLAVPIVVALAAIATAFALGTWQIKRKAWKETLIETLDQRLSAETTPVPPPPSWPDLDPAQNEFRRVHFSAEFIPDAQALVFTTGSSLRGDIQGPGYWVFALARLGDGSLLVVNRGFLPEDRKSADARSTKEPQGNLDMIGVMRWPQLRGYFSPKDDPGHNLWFVRDHLAIAAAKGWRRPGTELAPFFIDLEAPMPPSGWPRPGPSKPNLRNEHLQYAITWYGLAGALAAALMAWLRTQLRAGASGASL